MKKKVRVFHKHAKFIKTFRSVKEVLE